MKVHPKPEVPARSDPDNQTSFAPPSGAGPDCWRRLAACKDEVTALIAGGADLELALCRLTAALRSIADATYCAILLVDETGERFRRVISNDVPNAFREMLDGLEIQLGISPCGAAVCREEAIVVPDIESSAVFGWFRERMAPLGIRACESLPIMGCNGDAIATIAVFHNRLLSEGESYEAILRSVCPLIQLAIEHDQRAEALQSAGARFASLAASIPGVVYQRVVSPEGDIRYTYISDGARDLFGVSPEEIVADPQALFDCHAPEYSEDFRQRLVEASRDLSMWDVEAAIISRDGTHKWTHAIARPHKRADGAVVWDGVILDATRIKQANMELAASDRSKSEFLANMSHELRTPLNAIIGLAEVMREEVLGKIENPTYREYISDIHESGVHLKQIINDILDISRIETGKLDLNEEVIDVAQLIENAVKIVQVRAAENSVNVACRVEKRLPRLFADERKIKQIVINLLTNAIKFGIEGGHVLVSARVRRGGRLSISVADDGVGIDREHRGLVFEPFYQVDSGLDRSVEGAGLGLALTKAMVELHGATIELKSTKGAGTIVMVTFPKERTVGATLPASNHAATA